MSKTVTTSDGTYRETLQGDVLKRYNEKTACIGTDPYVIPAVEFDIDRTKWPDVGYVDVVNFLIFQKSSYTKDQLRNYKSLEAYRLFQDGWVKQLLHKDFNGIHLFRAKVFHSMRIREKPLEPWVLVTSEGTVEAAHCTCMAGLGECCSHAAAVLFALETATRLRSEATVTDSSAYWKFPSSASFDKPFVRLRKLDLQSAAKKRKLSESGEDPGRPESPKKNSSSTEESEEVKNFYASLKSCLPDAAILSLHEGTCDSFEPKSASVKWPMDLSSLYEATLAGKDYEDVLRHCDGFVLGVDSEQVQLVERETRKQSGSARWHSVRVGRVTASNFHAATHTDPTKPSKTVLQAICKPAVRSFSTKATEWGRLKEETGRAGYCSIMKQQHRNFVCRESGLFLNSNFPELGASPDGVVTCDCCGTGCLEIKCPYTQKDAGCISHMKFLTEKSDGAKCLDRKHPYYCQVQAQIHLTESAYCDFVVWTPREMTIERITPDYEFWAHYSKLATNFHRLCVMPELCIGYFSARSVLRAQTAVANSERSDSEKYCVCGGKDDGRKMIACENENCKYVWFHTVCIKMKKVPKGKWICRFCKK